MYVYIHVHAVQERVWSREKPRAVPACHMPPNEAVRHPKCAFILLGVWCRQFGTEVIPPKRVLKLLPDLFTHADEKVRAMAKVVTVELTKWIGKDAVKRMLLADLRPATVREWLGGLGAWGWGWGLGYGVTE